MRRIILLVAILIGAYTVQAQELNCTVVIDAEQTGQTNLQIFKTLEQQLTEFVNNTNWTNREYKNQERIDCSISLIISEYDGTTFTGSMQIGSSRPVFDSTYDSPVYNYNDKQVAFRYKEFEPLNFNLNTYESNLVSIVSYHIYTLIGLDADTFAPNGGENYFKIAKQIVGTAASSSFTGWKPTDGTQSRYQYNDAILSPVYKEFHTAMYDYHRVGLDAMSEDQKEAKNTIIGSIKTLKGINDRRPNSYLLRTFFDAKSGEIQSIFSGGPRVDIAELVENLTRMAPTKRSAWSEIKL
ncbi:type IX secretion system protein PorD [Ulvibacter antarcticus]|uniref:Uncharacterized protein DUF4835 n=1 Tax=Ulvibacter antarcticus TaxID=442714 RepID=A0A3L9ZE06_9FLAO|nr:DUF4835 family protein [Ulvibacter antarcticus]RMA64902.1 uncharacterized protein DUF4835 [Ulvibacter antarcticus]